MNNTKGFTLIELMVVVVIIGILAAIALPNYTTFQTKARQAEAKTALGAGYSALKSFYYENNTYTACATAIGITRDTSVTNLYAVGFGGTTAVPGTGCGVAATAACNFTAYDPVTGVGQNAATCATTIAPNVHGYDASGHYAPAPAGAAVLLATQSPTGFVNGAAGTVATAGSITNTLFSLGAAGQISPTASNIDRWAINQAKALSPYQPGL